MEHEGQRRDWNEDWTQEMEEEKGRNRGKRCGVKTMNRRKGEWIKEGLAASWENIWKYESQAWISVLQNAHEIDQDSNTRRKFFSFPFTHSYNFSFVSCVSQSKNTRWKYSEVQIHFTKPRVHIYLASWWSKIICVFIHRSHTKFQVFNKRCFSSLSIYTLWSNRL